MKLSPFSTKLCGYVVAYRFVCKGKPLHAVIRSPGHTALHSPPKTARTMNNFAKNCLVNRTSLSFSLSGSPFIKKHRPGKSQVAEIILVECLKDERAVQNFSKQRKFGRESDLYNFVFGRSCENHLGHQKSRGSCQQSCKRPPYHFAG